MGLCILKVARGSLLVQGRLIISVEVTITMPYSEKNRAVLDKCEELVKKHYPEPENSKFKDPFSHLRSGRGRGEN